MECHSRIILRLCTSIFVLLLTPSVVDAQATALTYRHDHHLFTLVPSHFTAWWGTDEVWMYNNAEIQPLPQWRSDGDAAVLLPEGVTVALRNTWNRHAIRQTLIERIGDEFNREAGSVTIGRTDLGEISFDGVGLLGRSLQLEEAVDLTIFALENAVYDIVLPVDIIQPELTVNDGDLQKAGISEVIAIGESNFAGSPYNRRHNIAVGLERFNGHLVPQGEQFSFNAVLGPVNARTGYKPELVILGDKTLPEYGGGLCQVSTTAYRGIWEYGFPIEQRKNHSFAVGYYGPQGTDATIYPPSLDMKFLNDSAGDILIQTHVDGDYAYFIYYGSADLRKTELVGPFNWDHKKAPPDRIEYVTSLPPGERLKVGGAVPGMKTAWFRITSSGSSVNTEGYYSIYEARPLYFQIGVESGISDTEEEVEGASQLAPIVQPVRRQLPRYNPRSLRR